MLNLGNLRVAGEKGGLPVLRGNLQSMLLETPLAIDPTGELTRKGEPIFTVRLKTPSGKVFEAGTAYRNVITTGENAGKVMWTIRVRKQPGIPEDIELAAWPEGEGEWYLTDGRARASTHAPRQESADLGDDNIPF